MGGARPPSRPGGPVARSHRRQPDPVHARGVAGLHRPVRPRHLAEVLMYRLVCASCDLRVYSMEEAYLHEQEMNGNNFPDTGERGGWDVELDD